MDTIEAIQTRRSVKKYDPEHRMSEAEVEQLLSLAMLSPTAFNLQNWRFVRVEDMALRRQIREVAWDQAQVTDASLLLVLTADLKAWEKEPGRYWRNAPEAAQAMVVPAIDAYYRDRPRVAQDEAMRSCGIAAQTLMLAARAMGYDSCPMDGFDFDAVGRIINLPEDHVISLMLAVGTPLEPARPRAGQLPYEEVVVRDRF